MRLDPAAVLAASQSWVYVPDETPEVGTDDVHLVFHPLTGAEPTAAWVGSDRSADDLVDRVLSAGAGAYRALLDHRLRLGVELGAPMALVKGRLETSAPILRRAGFTAYGVERAYRMVLA